MDLIDEKEKTARGHLWAIASISIGAILVVCAPRPAATELAASTEASRAGLEDIEEAHPALTPTKLVGLDEQRAVELLGPAMATESRPPANVWHYKSSRCELDLVFYMEMRTGRMRTLHYDFKSGADTSTQRQTCLTAIMQENSKNGLSDGAPENNMEAESSTESNIAPALKAKPLASRRVPPIRRSHLTHYSRWSYRYPVRNTVWGFNFGLRWSPAYTAATSGWGGGQFGPAPYSASGS
jgi:hypothetical protein